MTSTATQTASVRDTSRSAVDPALMVTVVDGVDELDGRPVSGYRPGDTLPGGMSGWARLGVGHRCETWLAWSDDMFQPVVVKFPRPDQLAHPRARRSLAREVAALGGLLHPALPRLYVDGTLSEDVPFVVLEFVDGIALDDALSDVLGDAQESSANDTGAINSVAIDIGRIDTGEVDSTMNGKLDETGRIGAAEVAVLGVQLLSAVRMVHRRGIVHVDIKPANVILRDGRAVLLDFGSARAEGACQPLGRLIGSAGYAAPELEAGAPIAPGMDVFGVGVTLWEARTGEPAFDPELSAADRPALAAADDGPLGALLVQLTDPDPVERPDIDTALIALARIADPAGEIVWPVWRRDQRP